jgi:hypothetical protein
VSFAQSLQPPTRQFDPGSAGPVQLTPPI